MAQPLPWDNTWRLDIARRLNPTKEHHDRNATLAGGLHGLAGRLQRLVDAGGQRSTLLFIDLDNFKTINDTLGQDESGRLLQEVGLRLSSCVRNSDTVARLGGEGKDSVDGLLRRADLAMYQAKAAGRNRMVFFDTRAQTAVSERAALDADLRTALRESQFALYYQPQVDAGGQCQRARVPSTRFRRTDAGHSRAQRRRCEPPEAGADREPGAPEPRGLRGRIGSAPTSEWHRGCGPPTRCTRRRSGARRPTGRLGRVRARVAGTENRARPGRRCTAF